MNDKIIIKPGLGHLDNVVSKIYYKTLPVWKCLHVTPNILTTLGLICSLISVYFFYINNLLSILFILLRMYFDYIDGLYARKYNIETKFGDYYDHFSDLVFFILFTLVIWKSMKGRKRILCLILLFTFALAFTINIGCIEKECKHECKNGDSLNLPKKMCFSSNVFKFTDNSILYIVMIIIILIRYKHGKKNLTLFKSRRK